MRAFELVAAAPAGATGPTSARAAARTAPAIQVFMQSKSSCNPCLHANHVFMRALPGRSRQPRKAGPRLAGLSQLTRTQAAGITSGASGDDDGDDNPNGGGGANGGGASDGGDGANALGW